MPSSYPDGIGRAAVERDRLLGVQTEVSRSVASPKAGGHGDAADGLGAGRTSDRLGSAARDVAAGNDVVWVRRFVNVDRVVTVRPRA
jgi:hypothetical protein